MSVDARRLVNSAIKLRIRAQRRRVDTEKGQALAALFENAGCVYIQKTHYNRNYKPGETYLRPVVKLRGLEKQTLMEIRRMCWANRRGPHNTRVCSLSVSSPGTLILRGKPAEVFLEIVFPYLKWFRKTVATVLFFADPFNAKQTDFQTASALLEEVKKSERERVGQNAFREYRYSKNDRPATLGDWVQYCARGKQNPDNAVENPPVPAPRSRRFTR